MDDGEGIDVQMKEGITYCSNNNFEYKVYEESVSGGKDFLERDVYRQLNDDIREGEIEGVYIRNVGRGWRDDRYKWSFVDMLKENECRLFSGGKEYDLNDKKDLMLLGLESIMYDFNRYDIVKQTTDGRVNKWKRGLGYSGRLMFGYKRIRDGKDKIIVVDEEKKKLIIDVYKMYLRKDCKDVRICYSRIKKKYEGSILYDLINYRLIYKILKNNYNGVLIINDSKNNEVYEFNVEPIIDNIINEKVKLKEKTVVGVRRGNSKTNYLLKGKVDCSCGMNMWVFGSSYKDGKNYGYYKCSRSEVLKRKELGGLIDKEISKECGKGKSIRIDDLDSIIWNGLFDFLEESEVLKEEYKLRVEEKKGKKNEFVGKIKYYNGELVKLDEKKNNSVDLLLERVMSKDEFKEWKIKIYDVEKSKIDSRLESLNSEYDKIDFEENIFDDYIKLMKKDLKKERYIDSFKDRLNKINKYVKNIVVDKIDKHNYDIFVKLNLDIVDDYKLVKEKDKKFYTLNFSKYIYGNLIYKNNYYLDLMFKYNKKERLELVKFDIV